MNSDSGNQSGIQADEHNSPNVKRRKVSPHKQQNQEKECAIEVITELNVRISRFCAEVNNAIVSLKLLQVDKGKIERKFKRLHHTSILTIAHLRNARDLLKSALNDVPSTSHQIPTNQSPPTLHQIPANRNPSVDNSPNQAANNSSRQQSTPSPSKVKSIMKTTETSPSMIQIQNMNKQVGVFISYIENVLINCNEPINEHKKLLANAILFCANDNLKNIEKSRMEIEYEFENNLDKLADRNPFPLYLDDEQISEEEKELIRKKRQPTNLHRTVCFLDRDERVIRIEKRDPWNHF